MCVSVLYAQKGLALLFCYSPYLAYKFWPGFGCLVGDLVGDLLCSVTGTGTETGTEAPSGANLCLLTINDDNNCLFRLCKAGSLSGLVAGRGKSITSAQFRPVLVTDREMHSPTFSLGFGIDFVLGLRPPCFLLLLHLLLLSNPLLLPLVVVVTAGPGALELTVASVFAIYTNAIRCHVPIFILR